jgi:hypothetical protein
MILSFLSQIYNSVPAADFSHSGARFESVYQADVQRAGQKFQFGAEKLDVRKIRRIERN